MFAPVANQPMTIFERMSGLAREHGAVNLGQGFPDFGWPEAVVERAARELTGAASQYPPMRGLPVLRDAVADHYRRVQALDVDAEQVTITSGATEALAAAILALVSPGDEVLLFQPLYDAYLPLVIRAGGVPVLASLQPPEWRITADLLDAAFTPRTRMVIFNNPHNPTARLFDAEELRLLAQACVRHDVIAISDEVWEHVIFGGAAFLPLSGQPGMAERTVKVGSAGKIFSLTGWKVGWSIAPHALAGPIARAHQFLTFTTPPNLQSAVAFGLSECGAHLTDMAAEFEASRDYLGQALAQVGYVTLPAQGTYFLSIDLPGSGITVDDAQYCDRAVRECGVAAIPNSALYADAPITSIVRLCFAKQRQTLDRGVEALAAARCLFRAAH